MFNLQSNVLITTSLVAFFIILRKLILIRIFNIEITEYVLVIKYHHPFTTRHNHPVLEIPVEMITDCKIEKTYMGFYLKIVIKKRNKYKVFIYHLDTVKSHQIKAIQQSINVFLDAKNNVLA